MGQPVKLSDALVKDARFCASLTERSIAGQIEFWAGLGKAIEGTMRTEEVLALKKSGSVRPLSDCLREVETPTGKARLKEYLGQTPFPHYEPGPHGDDERLIRIDADGTRTLGRFVDRQFVAEN